MQPHFANTVADILDDQQWIVEEDLLGLRLTDVMLFYALAAIAFIPIKPFDPRKIKHNVYYHHIQWRQETRGTEGFRMRCRYLGCFGRRPLHSRTPGPPPFSPMNSTPASSRALRIA